jgi:DNA modification methylase
MTALVVKGDCLKVFARIPGEAIDAVVTDPPYELGFMGKRWDATGIAYSVELWRQCRRVLKPGGYLIAFGATRTYHRMACAIEDAGFEIRDCIQWLYGTGFPKSLNVGKELDRRAGAERAVVGEKHVTRILNADDVKVHNYGTGMSGKAGVISVTAPATDDAKKWEGWGTALKPGHEPIVMARKPLVGTVAANVSAHGTGALNIDACRIATDDGKNRARPPRTPNAILGSGKGTNLTASPHNDTGRWPANVILDEDAAAVLDAQSVGTRASKPSGIAYDGGTLADGKSCVSYSDAGGASRFFYVAKASRKERSGGGVIDNRHPTVKPVKLMRYLVRMVTPRDGVVLDPFAGSGTTGVAAVLEGFDFIGIEREPQYVAIARARVAAGGKFCGS